MMNRIIITLLVTFWLPEFALSQIVNISATKIIPSEENAVVLNQSLTQYTVFTLNNNQLVDSLQINGACLFRLSIDEKYDWTVNLTKNDMRSPDYISTYVTDEGEFVCEKFEVNTFKGYTSNGQVARFTVDENNLTGIILCENKHIVIRPTKDYTHNESDRSFICYESTDIIRQESGTDYINDALEVLYEEDIETNIMRSVNVNTADPCAYYLEIATDADYEYFINAGGSGIVNTFQQILSVLNAVEGAYATTFNLKIVVTFQNVYTNSSSCPYTSSDGSTLFNQLKNYWNNNRTSIVRDIAHLFTGKNPITYIDENGNTLTIAGLAKLGALSNINNAYGFSRNHTYIHFVTTHEIGHNLNAEHATQSSCTCGGYYSAIMCPVVSSNPNLWFCDESINQIATYLYSKRSLLTPSFPTNSTLSGTKTGYKAYTVLNKIESTQDISSGMTEYIAGNEIVLKPGFHAHTGSDFSAKIETPETCEPIYVVSGLSSDVCFGTGITYTVYNAQYFSFKVYSLTGALIYSNSGMVQGNTVQVWNATGISTYYYTVVITFYSPNDEYTNTYTIFAHNCSNAPAMTDKTTDIQEKKANNSNIALVPNPNSGTFRLETDIANSDIENIQIYNTLGQLIFGQHGYNGSSVILPSNQKGLFVVKVSTAKQVWNGKMLVE
jgi:hypothetical protein